MAQQSKITKAALIQETARKSLEKLFRSLSAFAFDCGLSMREVNLILRTAAVQTAAIRQLENGNRVNISGIAAITGIPRGEVAGVLNSGGSTSVKARRSRQNVISRILSAWHCDPEYLTASRRARELNLFGSGSTFDSLVKTYGQGIPMRAILDELKRLGAIQLSVSSQKVSPKVPLAINPRITYKKIADFDGATADLFLSLLSSSDASFVEKMSGTKVWSGRIVPARKRFGANAAALLRELRTELELKQEQNASKDAQTVAHLSIKIAYREEKPHSAKQSLKSRQNLQRNR